jgi:hypothetical protein
MNIGGGWNASPKINLEVRDAGGVLTLAFKENGRDEFVEKLRVSDIPCCPFHLFNFALCISK